MKYIKNYNLYLVEEGISVDTEDIIDILKSLENKNSKDERLINKLISKIDNQGKNILMNIVQSNNEELIDYILKFNIIDINHKTKKGENILFFCKNIKMFNKFYNLGADVHAIRKDNVNILNYLSSKKIFNVDLYQKLINDGVDINQNSELNNKNYHGDWAISVLSNSILNKNILKLLIKNNVDLNNKETQVRYLDNLFYTFKYYIKKRSSIIEIFKILFQNGLKIIDYGQFLDNIIDFHFNRFINNENHTLLNFIKPLANYITEDIFIDILKKINTSRDSEARLIEDIFSIGIYPKLYLFMKKYYGIDNFNKYFKNIIDYEFYEDTINFNL